MREMAPVANEDIKVVADEAFAGRCPELFSNPCPLPLLAPRTPYFSTVEDVPRPLYDVLHYYFSLTAVS